MENIFLGIVIFALFIASVMVAQERIEAQQARERTEYELKRLEKLIKAEKKRNDEKTKKKAFEAEV